jgi:hypothetical protein
MKKVKKVDFNKTTPTRLLNSIRKGPVGFYVDDDSAIGLAYWLEDFIKYEKIVLKMYRETHYLLGH